MARTRSLISQVVARNQHLPDLTPEQRTAWVENVKATKKWLGSNQPAPTDSMNRVISENWKTSTPINNALRNGRGPLRGGNFGRPGLLMIAIGAGTAGAVMGNGDFSSFALGAGAGVAGGYAAEAGASAVYKGLTSYARKNASEMSAGAFKAVHMGRAMTSAGSRGMIFGTGALLASGLFSSMFASNSKSYKQGFNANRGNSIVR
jgi:hypothetical protein